MICVDKKIQTKNFAKSTGAAIYAKLELSDNKNSIAQLVKLQVAVPCQEW